MRHEVGNEGLHQGKERDEYVGIDNDEFTEG
jgi:hypothetical protein